MEYTVTLLRDDRARLAAIRDALLRHAEAEQRYLAAVQHLQTLGIQVGGDEEAASPGPKKVRKPRSDAGIPRGPRGKRTAEVAPPVLKSVGVKRTKGETLEDAIARG